jgi:hypothetical protein
LNVAPVRDAYTAGNPAAAPRLLPSRIFDAVPHDGAAYSAAVTVPESTGEVTLPGAAPSPLVGYYQGAGPVPSAAPATRRFDLGSVSVSAAQPLTFSPVLNPQGSFDATASGSLAGAVAAEGASVALPLRVGRVRLTTHADAAQAEQPNLALTDQALGTGATFDVRAGARNLGLDVSSHYEHFTVNQPGLSGNAFDSSASYGLSNGTIPVFVPAYADVSKRTYSAGIAVPITQRFSANLQYDTQHLFGGYGAPGIENLDANTSIYGARFTYALPKNASLSLTARQYRYQDNLNLTNAYTQTSANVDLTVKF